MNKIQEKKSRFNDDIGFINLIIYKNMRRKQQDQSSEQVYLSKNGYKGDEEKPNQKIDISMKGQAVLNKHKNQRKDPNEHKIKLKKQIKKNKIKDKSIEKQQNTSKYIEQNILNNKNSKNSIFLKSRRLPIQHQQQFTQVNQAEAIKIWTEINQIYFKHLTYYQINQKKQNLASINFPISPIEAKYNEFNCISTYKDQVILQQFPELKIRNKISAIFTKLYENKLNEAFLVLFECQKLNQKMINQQQVQSVQNLNNIINLQTFGKNTSLTNFSKNQEQESYLLNLKTTNVINITQSSQKIIKYHKIVSNPQYKTQIQKQLAIWKWQLNNQQTNNKSQIRTIQKISSSQNNNFYNQKQVDLINQKLLWSNILKLFKQGHADKTTQIFQYYKIQQQNLELRKTYRPSATKGTNQDYLQKFETDCKICFCSSNHDNNKVLYCDNCNTSFHQFCYGLSSIPKSDTYFCDTCIEQKKNQTLKKNVFFCKICWRRSFPMKNINGHFYHVTCLILNNFVQIRNKQLVLKQSINFQIITEKVIKSELRQKHCEYCVQMEGSQNGLQFHCNYAGCCKTFHPICAYLNGCLFILNIQKSQKQLGLSVKVFCNNHNQQRDYVEQVYFRRYVCDKKKTSQLDYESFKKVYHEQQEHRQKFRKKAQIQNYNKLNLFKVTKILKDHNKKLKQEYLDKITTETSKLLKKQKAQRSKSSNNVTNKIKNVSFFDD